MYAISKKAKYALRALFELARRYQQGPVLIAELAKHHQIPKKFLESILLELRNTGMLGSKKGKGGGYFLARAPGSIRIGEVIRALDGPMAPVPCVSQTAYRTCEECEDEATCGIRALMQDVRDATARILDQESLEDLLKREEQLEQKRKKVLVYAI
ncbi:MAG: Rrf2 family transcriptional regulator [Candidatus Omnitrophica bacterium]|nr:Rrf2 family transcriptional regulator [Candidatus Omnitrophota bacterium]